MLNLFLKNSFIYIIGNVLIKGSVIFLIPIYTRYLTPLEYGVVDLFVIISTLINLAIPLEIVQSVTRFYQGSDKANQKEYVSTAFIFTLIMYFIFISISLVFADELTLWLLDNINYKNIYILAIFSISSGGIFYFAQNQLKCQLKAKENILCSIINVFFISIISVLLMIFSDMKVESIFIGQIAGNMIALYFSIYLAKHSYQFIFVFKKLKEMIIFSIPIVLSSLAVFVSLYIDRIIIKDLLGLYEFGVYGLAYKFAMVAGLIMLGFQSSLTPLIYKHYAEKETPTNISNFFDNFVIFALFVLIGSILFSKEIVIFMSTESYYSAENLIPILVMAVFLSNMYIFAPGLVISKNTKIIALISIVCAIINTVLNYILIPYLYLYGAALATLISSLISFFLYLKANNKYYKINFNWNKIIPLTLGSILFAYLIKMYFLETEFLNICIKFLLLLIFIIVSERVLFKKMLINKLFTK